MLDFVIELIFEIVLEGSVEILGEKKAPMIIRVIAAIVAVGVFIGAGGLFLYIGYMVLMEKQYLVALVCFMVGLFILILGFFGIRKKLRKRKEES